MFRAYFSASGRLVERLLASSRVVIQLMEKVRLTSNGLIMASSMGAEEP